NKNRRIAERRTDDADSDNILRPSLMRGSNYKEPHPQKHLAESHESNTSMGLTLVTLIFSRIYFCYFKHKSKVKATRCRVLRLRLFSQKLFHPLNDFRRLDNNFSGQRLQFFPNDGFQLPSI